MMSEKEPVIRPGLTSLRSIVSDEGDTVNYINAKEAHNAEELLAEIGYKQELNRTFSTIQVFGIAFSIMGLLPSIATVMSIGLEGGPVGLLWGWLFSSVFIVGIGIGMSELSSSIPTSGGLYYWTYYYAPVKQKAFLSFIIGTSNSLALSGGLCSITYGFATQILAAVYLGQDGDFTITNGIIYGVFAAGIFAELLVTCLASSAVSKLQTLSIFANCGLILLFFFALPIGKAHVGDFNDAKFIFGKFENFTDWNNGWTFFLSSLTAAWTIGAFDSCVHMSEEAKDPSRSVPIGIVGSITVCGILGWLIMIVINACLPKDISLVLDSDSGQPLAQLFYICLGKKWAVAFISLVAVCQFFMGASIMTAISRQIWAFARDDGLPFSSYIKVVNKRLRVPIRAVIFSAVMSLLIGLLILAGTVAANALFSIGIVGNYVSWATPQILRFTSGRGLFKPGPFYTGRILSPIINGISITFQVFIIILAVFPSSAKLNGPASMNYSVVVNCGIWGLSMVYYFVYKRKTFSGPKSNLTDDEFIEAVNKDNNVIDGFLITEKA